MVSGVKAEPNHNVILQLFFLPQRALGVVLFYLINREYPFHANNAILETQLSYKVKFGPRCSIPQPSADLENILSRMLDAAVETRISIFNLMKHPWYATQMAAVEATVPKPKTPTESTIRAEASPEASTSTSNSSPTTQQTPTKTVATAPDEATPGEQSNTPDKSSSSSNRKKPQNDNKQQ